MKKTKTVNSWHATTSRIIMWLSNAYVLIALLRKCNFAKRNPPPQHLPDGQGDCQMRWRYITNADINSMVCDCCAETGANISAKEILTVLNAGSRYIPRVHPLREYVLSLRPYTPDQPDWIDMVARQVRVRNSAQGVQYPIAKRPISDI